MDISASPPTTAASSSTPYDLPVLCKHTYKKSNISRPVEPERRSRAADSADARGHFPLLSAEVALDLPLDGDLELIYCAVLKHSKALQRPEAGLDVLRC